MPRRSGNVLSIDFARSISGHSIAGRQRSITEIEEGLAALVSPGGSLGRPAAFGVGHPAGGRISFPVGSAVSSNSCVPRIGPTTSSLSGSTSLNAQSIAFWSAECS